MSHLSLAFFGSFQVLRDGAPATGFDSDKGRALLAYLAVESDHPHRREALAGLLWPDAPAWTARHSLSQALSNLRRVVGDEPASLPCLLITRQTVRFNPASDHRLDVAVFTRCLATSHTHAHPQTETCRLCVQPLEEAAQLYHGDFLAGFALKDSQPFDEWRLARQEWYHRQALQVLTRLTGWHTRAGNYDPARRYALRQLELEPWREIAYRQFMQLLALSGQRSAALAQYEACRRILAEELGVAPAAETTALYEQIRDQGAREKGRKGKREKGDSAPPPLRPSAVAEPVEGPPHNLPAQLTTFVGREAELALLTERLAQPDYRLITVAGPGGIGKTRLALRVAERQIGLFGDGVYFVALAGLESPAEVAPAIAGALGVTLSGQREPQAQLIDHLRDQEMLLVLDNFEHLLAGADLVLDILREAPQVVILVTSRERLNFQAESLLTLHGLPFPTSEQDPHPADYAAVRLFLQRAGQVQMGFALSPHNRPDILRICQHAQGLPLAIELAAAGVASHSCAEIARALAHNMDTLSTSMHDVPARHRSMQAVLEHSWTLLSEAEQWVLAHCAVFRGGFTRAAAHAVFSEPSTGDGDETDHCLATLVDKSLLRQSASGRYELHELVRQFADHKLAEDSGEYAHTRECHSRYFAQFLSRREEPVRGAGQKEALEDIQREIENVRVAWMYAVEQGHPRIAEEATESLFQFYYIRGHYEEGVTTFERAVAALRKRGEETSLLAGKLLGRCGYFYSRLGMAERAEALFQDYLAIAQHHGDERETALALNHLGDVATHQGKYTEAAQWYQKSLALWEDIGPERSQAALLNNLGSVMQKSGNYAAAGQLFRKCLVIKRKSNASQESIGTTLSNLGEIEFRLGHHAEARRLFEESLALRTEIGDRHGMGVVLNSLGELALQNEDWQAARRLLRDGAAIKRETGDRTGLAVSLCNLARVSLAMEREREAKAYLHEALETAVACHADPVVLECLTVAARLAAERGEQEKGAVWLGYVIHAPAATQETQDRAERLVFELKGQLPASLVEGALRRGAARGFGDVVEGVLEFLERGTSVEAVPAHREIVRTKDVFGSLTT